MSPDIIPGTGIAVDTINGMMPTQAEGHFDDCPFYFRARHGEWDLDVCRPGGDPVWPKDPIYHAEGDDPSEGCMEDGEVRKILAAHWAGFEAARKALG